MTATLIDPYTERPVRLGDDWQRSAAGLLLPQRERRRRRYDRPVAVDLFAGAGGFGCGFHQAGFHVAAASEMDLTASCTYMVNLARPGVKIHTDRPQRMDDFARYLDNRPHHVTDSGLVLDDVAGSGWIANQPDDHPGCEHFFLYDVHNLTGEIILDALGLEPGDVAVVTGGPPCQGFSAAGKRDVMDPRNSLVFEFARLICEIQPKAFVMENVPPMLDMVTAEGIPVVDAFALAVAEGGYGDYDALRKSMRSLPGARAATGRKATAAKKPAGLPADDQIDLFGDGEARR